MRCAAPDPRTITAGKENRQSIDASKQPSSFSSEATLSTTGQTVAHSRRNQRSSTDRRNWKGNFCKDGFWESVSYCKGAKSSLASSLFAHDSGRTTSEGLRHNHL